MFRRFATVIKQVAALTLFCAAPAACVVEATELEEMLESETGEASSELRQAGMPCAYTCQCVAGTTCEWNEYGQKVCTPILDFGPFPEGVTCAASCQCPNPKSCVFSPGEMYGTCQDPKLPCASDCDCGTRKVCVSGKCYADFGPYPECRCSKHCPYGDACVGGACQ